MVRDIELARELEQRGEPAIRQILSFLDHPLDRVRCLAADFCYPIAPERCSEALIAISDNGGLMGMDAAMALLMHDGTATERLKTPKLKKRLEDNDAALAKLERDLKSRKKS